MIALARGRGSGVVGAAACCANRGPVVELPPLPSWEPGADQAEVGTLPPQTPQPRRKAAEDGQLY